MAYRELRNWNNKEIIFAGEFLTWKACLEAAVDRNVCLDYLYLENMDLGPVNLDGASLNYARITRCHLRGSNLSETSMIKSEWTECDLSECSFTDSVMVNARFLGSDLHGADIRFCDMRSAMISCLGFLKTDFSHSTHIGGSVFISNGVMCPMSRPPIFIRGTGLDAILLDEHIILGGTIILRKEDLDMNAQGVAGLFLNKGICPNRADLHGLWHALREKAA